MVLLVLSIPLLDKRNVVNAKVLGALNMNDKNIFWLTFIICAILGIVTGYYSMSGELNVY
jgi:hypothetical protein